METQLKCDATRWPTFILQMFPSQTFRSQTFRSLFLKLSWFIAAKPRLSFLFLCFTARELAISLLASASTEQLSNHKGVSCLKVEPLMEQVWGWEGRGGVKAASSG